MVTNPPTEFRLPLPYNKMGEYNQNQNIGQQGLEFDGTTVLCRVCGDKASGFHYGVHSCEGCKGFFRRSIQQKIQYRPCTKNQQCSILRVNRNRCQYCRLKKCITVGMSRDAVRFGRVPKREKAKILAAMQASHINKTNELILNEGLNNINELKSVIINAHYSTCDFTKAKIDTLIKESLSSRGERTASASTSFLTCPLNPINYSSADDINDNFSNRFSPAIRGVVEFAKLLPGFNSLTKDDQIILLRNGVFEVLLLRLSNMFLNNNTMLCINGKVVNIINIDEENGISPNSTNSDESPTVTAAPTTNGSSTISAKFLIKSMFKFTTSFNQWNLDDDITGVFSAIILMSWDRPGLRNPDLIKKLQSHYRTVLHNLLPSEVCDALESKIPDLRTLNTLHSEKLLSFKMDGIKCSSGGNKSSSNFAAADHQEMTAMEDDDASRETTSSTSISTGSPPSVHSHGHSHIHSQPINIGSSSHHGCPYANGRDRDRDRDSNTTTIFPVSPSNDSGIESGACSSPSRSEVSETFYNGSEESMPVLKRALQAPPLIDNQYVPTNYYNDERPSESERTFHYNVGHKKFRRSTITPPTDMSTSSRTSTSSPPQQNQPAATIPNHYNNQPIKQETITITTSTNHHHHHYDNHNHGHNLGQTVITKPKEATTPVQLYPQLASALTRPLPNYSSNHHHHSHSSTCSGGSPSISSEMSTLKQSLLKPTISNNEETSNYIHSLIMRDEYGPPVTVTVPVISRPMSMGIATASTSARPIQETNQIPLNLCIKTATPPTAPSRSGIAT